MAHRFPAEDPVAPLVGITPADATAAAFDALGTDGEPTVTSIVMPHGRRLELAVPDHPVSTPPPVVVYLHGGGFVSGSHRATDNPVARLVTAALLPRGLAVAGVEYRLADHASYPAPIDDAQAAVSWLRAHGPRHGLDSAHIGGWGNSAGGYLVAMLAVTGAITAGVSWYGPTNLRRQPRLGPQASG